MARSWEEYLFSDHHAVAVSPWKGATGLQLFDLMVRRNDHFFKTGQAGLRQVGSFFGFGLRKGEDVETLQPVDKLKEALHNFVHQKTTETSTDDSEEEPIIRREALPSLTETVSASSKNLASVMEYANVDNSSSKAMTCTLDDVSLHCVDRDALRAAIHAWKPDMASLTKYTSPSLFRGLVDLFLITDILYAGHVTVEDETSRSIGAGVDAGLAGQVFGVEAAAKLEAQHSNGSKKELTGGHIPFAIRVVRLRYNSEGELYRVLPESRAETMCSTVCIREEVLVSESKVEFRSSGESEVVYRPSEVVDVGEVYASETIEVGGGDANGIVRVLEGDSESITAKVVEGDDASGMVEVRHLHVSRMVNGDAPGMVEVVGGEAPKPVEVVEESELVSQQDEPDKEEEARAQARVQAEEEALWFKNNYDPLSEYKCEMGDFFGDDLCDLAGDGSVIQLDIDIEAHSDAASESATLHTKLSDGLNINS